MNDKQFSRFKIAERIQEGFQYLELGYLFLLELKEALAFYWLNARSNGKLYYKKIVHINLNSIPLMETALTEEAKGEDAVKKVKVKVVGVKVTVMELLVGLEIIDLAAVAV